MAKARRFDACPGEAEESAAAGAGECVRWSRSDEGKERERVFFFYLRFEAGLLLEITLNAVVLYQVYCI